MSIESMREILAIIDREFLDAWRHHCKQEGCVETIRKRQEASKRAICAYIDAAADRAAALATDERLRDLHL